MNICKKIVRRLRFYFENKFLVIFFRLKPIKNIILFESVPDLSDNTRAVFDEMVRQGINKEYQMVWLIRNVDISELPSIDNVAYVPAEGKTFKERMRVLDLKNTAKCLVCCNFFLLSERKGQTSFYLGHGSPIKSVRGYYNLPKRIDHCLIAAPDMVDVISYEMKYDKRKAFALGYPRNDVFCKPGQDLHEILGKEYDKVIVWYPTFRQHSSGGNKLTKNAFPIIHDQEKARSINDFARENNVLIVVKPHFAQDVSYITDMNLSNIMFINEKFLKDHNISSYQFVNSCDALITDYSSIYYDYTLCNKPIALVWEDYDEYRANVGFAVDMDRYMKGAEKVYTLDDFCSFVKNVAEENDVCRKDRNEIKMLVNFSDDGESSRRVVEFILEKMS